MKLKRNAWCFIGVLVSAIVLMSCSSGGGGGGDPAGGNYEITDRPLTPLTMANLAGTWFCENYSTIENQDADGTVLAAGTIDRTITFNAYGTYLQTEVYHMTSATNPTDTWVEYSYERGTVSCDGITIDKEATGEIYPSVTPMENPADATWVSANYETIETCMIYQNRLYYSSFQREGTGSGINGTWQSYHYRGSSSSTTQLVITDTTFTEYDFRDANPPSLLSSATYTLSDDNILHLISDLYSEYDTEVVLCGDKLVISDMNMHYTKQ